MHSVEEESPCDSEVWPGTDGDSGNSTVHSPDGPKSCSPYITHGIRLQIFCKIKLA